MEDVMPTGSGKEARDHIYALPNLSEHLNEEYFDTVIISPSRESETLQDILRQLPRPAV